MTWSVFAETETLSDGEDVGDGGLEKREQGIESWGVSVT